MRSALRGTIVVLLGLGVVLGAALLLARQQRFEWTTDSRAALEAFREGQAAAGKLYTEDAMASYERALAADPDFAAAQLYLVLTAARDSVSPQRLAELVEALQQHDLEELTPRERTLLRVFRSRASGERDQAREILRDYLEEHPDDPYVLDIHCMDLTTSGPQRQEEAEQCLRHLIEVDPNRVQAQNLLAYLAMNRGDFGVAEERFEIYRYLAPDQANPHDSLGELLMVTGRYGRAREEFRTAVSLKPDFCPSWNNLVLLELLEHHPAGARGVVREARQAGACPDSHREDLLCRVELWSLATDGQWEELWQRSRPEAGPCREGDPEAAHLGLRAALETGRLEEARRLLEEVEAREPGPGQVFRVRDFLARHMEALLAAAEGDPEAAAEALRRVDRNLVWGGGLGIFRLFNRLQLAGVLAGAGETQEAAAVMRSLAEVNRPFATDPPIPPVHPVPEPLAVPEPPATPEPPAPPGAPTTPEGPTPPR